MSKAEPVINNNLRLGLAIFLCSLSGISFEIALTRVFSVSLSYHFAFMVVSIAMMGIALSGTVLSVYPALADTRRLRDYALSLALAIPAAYVLINLVPLDPARLPWDSVQLLFVFLYYVILCVPFFFFGLLISASFSAMKGKAGFIYGADLLGAGVGSVAVIQVMRWLGPGRTVFVISFGAVLGAFLLGRRRAAVPAAACLAALLLSSGLAHMRISPYKELPAALGYPGAEHIKTYRNGFSRVDVFKSPMARFAPGLSLRHQEELPEQIGLSVDGANITAITRAGGNAHGFLGFLPSALPYEIGARKDALVIDPRGGLPVLMARRYGVQSVRSVESNPLLVDIIKGDYGEFSGNVYSEAASSGIARSRLRGTDMDFDVIDISLMEATPSAGFGMSEDYRYTVEAFKEYLGHLRKDGVLSISLYILPPPRIEFRLLATALSAMSETGVVEAGRNIAAIRSWGSICIVVKKSPLTSREIGKVKSFAGERDFDLVYYPGIREEETNIHVRMPESEYFSAFKRLIDPETREAFKEGYLFDISEVSDERPFFHFYLKPSRVIETYGIMGGKWQYFIEEGYLLPVVFAQALLISLVLLLIPALKGRGRASSTGIRPVSRAGPLSYFALIGLGFMFIEVPLIQEMMLPLENPSYAIAAVLASVLISSGIGSLLSQRFAILRRPYVVLLIAAVTLPYAFLFSTLLGDVTAYGMPVRVTLSSALIMPLGLLLGIPFPMGIRNIPEELIPWAWAVNGCFSVLAPMLAAMAAMAAGFKWVLALGAAMYALAFLFAPSGGVRDPRPIQKT
jgi:hypothetical protein